MFTISVCMIVKDECVTLSRCLDCVKKFADEIVIVDTGSKDNTKEIAKNYTQNIFDFEWIDDFSKARNFSFDKGHCDYLMWIDADDIITDENIDKILALKKSNQDADVFMFKYVFDNMVYFRERLLKRSKNFRWQGFVHEAIAPAGNVIYCDIEVHHKKEKPSDPTRNLSLYQKALKRGEKFGARETYYYARELFYNSHFDKAIFNFKRFLKMKNTYLPDRLGAYLLLSDCFMAKKEVDSAQNTLFEALSTFTPTAEMCCKIGYTYKFQNKPEHAIFWFNSALICQKQTTGFVQKDYENIIPLLELVTLNFSLNRFEEAKFFHAQCNALFPNHPSVKFNNTIKLLN